MFGFLGKGLKAVAAGGAQRQLGLQSPFLPNAIVRVGRFLYAFSAGWIGVSWYVGYANARTQTGAGPSLVLPGKPVVNTVDRPSHTPGYAGTRVNGKVPSVDQGNIAGATGGSARLAVARLALAQTTATNFIYAEVRPMPHSLLSRPCRTDCSGFFTLLYKAIRAKDPNGNGYSGYGNTDSLQQHGVVVQRPNLGDAAFFQNPDHVCIVVGTGNDPALVGFGAPPRPVKNSVSIESRYHDRFMGFRSYL